MALDPMKFFRKHNKKLLAVFMALLLVVWLGGNALESLLSPSPESRVVFHSRFGDMRFGDHGQALHVTRILEQIGLPWNAPAGYSSGQTEPLTLYDWMLLTREAHAMGFDPRPDDAVEFLNAQGITTNVVNRLANRIDVAPEHIYAAVNEFQSVDLALSTVGRSVPISEAEVRVAARDVLEKVKVQLVALPAESFLDEEATFTEEELTDQFTAYREQEAGPGTTFGYFLPPRIKAQYIKLDVAKVDVGLRESEEALERRAREYWRQNRDKDPAFLRPPTTQPADEPTAEPTAQGPEEGGPASDDRVEAESPPAQGAEPPAAPGDESSNAETPETEASDVDQPDSDTPDEGTEDNAGSGTEPQDTAGQPEPLTNPGSAEAEPDQADEPPSEQPPPSTTAIEEPVVGEPAPVQAPTTQPAPDRPVPEQPAPAKPESKYFETYPEAHEAAMSVVRRQAAVAEVHRIAEYIGQRIADPWYDMAEGKDGYKPLPPAIEDLGVDDPDYYDKIIAGIPPELRYQGVVTTATTDWFTQEEASSVPGLGGAAMETREGGPATFGQFAFLVKGLAEIPKRGRVDRTVFLAPYQSSAHWLIDGDGNRYLYRITDLQAARAPESLDEVREKVVEDLRLQRASEEAQRRAEALLAEAKEVGLKAAWEAQTELKEIMGENGGYRSAAPFARKQLQLFAGFSLPVSVDGVGVVEDAFLERCFELGPASEGKEQLAVIPAPELAQVVAVEWESTEPMRKDAYARQRPTLLRQIQATRQVRLVSEWLNPELIRSRNGFKFPSEENG